jgi:hypothetical protein
MKKSGAEKRRKAEYLFRVILADVKFSPQWIAMAYVDNQ